MNIQKFTQKSIDAVNQLEKVASDFGNQEIEQEHLLYALLHQDQSLIAQLVSKMGIDERLFDYDLTQMIEARPKVSGGQAYVGQYLNKALLGAEDGFCISINKSIFPEGECHEREISPGIVDCPG